MTQKTNDKPKHSVREAWLQKAVGFLRPIFHTSNHTVPDNVRVSVGFPYSGKNKATGECWDKGHSADEVYEIFITPKLADPMAILATLTHELVHTVVGVKAKHKKVFKQCADAIGLEGKATSTYAGEELATALHGIKERLGSYPHGALLPVKADKQTTRLLKLECVDCGCIIRITQKWLDAYQEWSCPCGGKFYQEIKGENGN